MKVHPMPRLCNIAQRYDVASSVLAQSITCRQKKLRRLPHVFEKVLELPFHSNADVSISETPHSLRFAVSTDDYIGGDVMADAVEIYPGVTKIVVRGDGVEIYPEFELDLWRFRLPDLVRPELASAAYEGGELVVTVPIGSAETEEVEGIGNGSLFFGNVKNLYI